MPTKSPRDMSPEEMEALYLQEADTPEARKRIQALIRRLHDAHEQIAALETAATGHAAALEAAKTEAATAATTAAEQTWTARLAERDEDLALARAGVTDGELVHLVRRAHERTDADPTKRPKLEEWVQRIRTDEAARAGLSPLLVAGLTAQAAAGGGAAGGGAGTAAGTRTAATVVASGRDPAPLTEEAVRAAFAAGEKGVSELLARMGG